MWIDWRCNALRWVSMNGWLRSALRVGQILAEQREAGFEVLAPSGDF